MVSFYPGPSRIYDEIPRYVKDAVAANILSMNHRSEEFIALSKRTAALLKQKLSIPKNYTILYTSSATECWEIIAQSLVKEKSYHFFSGAFGKKWFEYTLALNKNAEGIVFSREEPLDPIDFSFPYKHSVICITHNETSNGTQVNNAILKKFRIQNPEAIIAVDATSSMAGAKLDFKQADVWFASVQKCFGLPAGMAIMICSPQAVRRAMEVNEKLHYNSLVAALNMMDKWQTTYTPNVLGIYLLMRVMEKTKSIEEIDAITRDRFLQWQEFFAGFKNVEMLIANKKVRSFTVIPIQSDADTIQRVKVKANKAGIVLGEGYGDLKPTTFRIANFPAIRDKEIAQLKKTLRSILT